MKLTTGISSLSSPIAVLSLGLSLAGPSAWGAQPAPDNLQHVREAIVQHVQKNDIPGMAVAVWQDGKILWEEGFGWADRAARTSVTEHTMFCLASLSKTLTASALMTLVQEGKVNLDQPANDYLGDDKLTSYIGDPKRVTVRRLANHTSGLPGSDQWFYGPDRSKTPDFSQTLRRYGILVAPAGERYRYSNLGYGVLGYLMSRVTGESYGQVMQERLFVPLGMTHSALDIMPGFEPYKATRYDYAGQPIPDYRSAEPASATLYSSVHDLARFGMYMLKDRLPDQRAVLSDESIDRMTRDPVVDGPNSHYGIGWDIEERGGYRTMEHSGSASGVSSNFVLIPSENVGVVMVANTDGGVPTKLFPEVLKVLLPKWQEAKAEPPAKPPVPFKPKADLVGRWEGKVHTYEGDIPMQLKILASGDIHVNIGNPPRFSTRSRVEQPSLLNNVAFDDGMLTGSTLSQIQTSDTARNPHTVSLYLKQRGNVLNGAATAASIYNGLWIYGLPYWTELKRVAAE